MKRARLHVVPLALLLASQFAWASDAVQAQPPDQQGIDRVRAEETSRLDQEEALCQTRFAVNRCADLVRRQRLEMLARLRRQESVLNAARRTQRAAEQRLRLEEKATAHAADKNASDSASDDASLPEPPSLTLSRPRSDISPKTPAPARLALQDIQQTDTAVIRASNAETYERKQAEAQKRRESVERRLKEQAKKSRSLPIPD